MRVGIGVVSLWLCVASACDDTAVGGTVAIASGPASLTHVADATFTLRCERPGCEIECALDGAAFEPCDTTVRYPGVSDGAHRFAARTSGDPTEVTATWTVDTIAMAVSITSAPAPMTNVTDGALVFSCADAACVTDCALDGVTVAGCTSPWSIPAQLDGEHTATIRGRDAAGNVATATATWQVDTIEPSASFASAPADLTRETTSVHALACNERPCTFTCSLDGSAFMDCTSPVVQTGTPDGHHRLDVRATDAAGNTGAIATDTWVVETVPATTARPWHDVAAGSSPPP